MIPKLLAASSLAAVLVLAGTPAQAAGSRHGGGGRSGGGRAVSSGARHAGSAARSAPGHFRSTPSYRSSPSYRSGPSYATRGGIAERRHPRAGTGGHYRSGYGSYRPYAGRYYRPYRSYYGWGYGRSYFGASLYFGWPYYPGGYFYPGYYAPYYDGYGYGYGYDQPDYAYPGYRDSPGEDRGAGDAAEPEDVDRDLGRLRLEVEPDDATVYVDDAFRGTAREARLLRLSLGRHVLELVRPGFRVERREVTITSGETAELQVELQRR
jgi:PEGA domain-containing protein